MRDSKNINRFTLPIVDVHIVNEPITIGSGDDEQTLIPSDDKVLFSFTLLHSFPKINTNGATFSYPLLRKYIATAINSPIDFEHKIEGSPAYEGENIIIGAILSADLPELENADDIFPTEGQPVKCVGVLWCRITEANQIVQDLEDGKEWRVSMEVTRDPDRDVFLLGEEIIRQDDSVWDAVYGAWIQRKQYNGKDIGLALGGTGLEEGDSANFFGAGVVWNPADEDADIHDFKFVPVATQNNNHFMAIATHANKKESEMAKEKPKIIIETGGVLGDASLTINGTKIEDFDNLEFVDSKIWNYWSLYWSKDIKGEDGIMETQSFYFDPTIASIIANKGGNPMDLLTQIKELVTEKYAKYISPDDMDSMVATKVQEKLEADYKDYISPADLETKIAEALTLRDENEKVFVARETVLTDATIELTQERKDEIRKFEISKDGDDKFNQWFEEIKVEQANMESELDKKGIEVTDEVKNTIASMSGVKDPRFVSAVAMLASAGVVKDKPIPGQTNGDGGNDNKPKYVH